VAGAKGFKPGHTNKLKAVEQLSLAVNLGRGALDHAEHWEKPARLALSMELSWMRLGPPLWLRSKRRVFTSMWLRPHYKWQHMAAPHHRDSIIRALLPSPVHLCLLLVLRGKYLAKK